ncbi:hypothetical protein HPB48_001078 [Haemaphysalis longicornis]|uniref:Uncharacterized protein n=1 Tax=Haemaphysalis longicornis TaxID=44386 RepID=A0A9J6GFJ2_HAELO|nr:hypothetical protein HPB48_001078 [Haemaphysalis longicornis]
MHALVPLGTQANRLLQVDRRSVAVQTDSSIEQRKCCKCTCHGRKHKPLPPDFAPLIASTLAHKRYKQLDVSTSSASFCESAAEDHEDTSFRPSADNSMQEDTTELPHAERKFIVFESALLKLFERCAECSQRCKVTTHVQGTLLKITAECGDHYKVWYSQPLVNGMAAGNILLCAAIMFSGASPTKVLRLLASVNISVPSKTCYMVYQKGCLVPAIKKVRHREVPLKNWNSMEFVILQALKAEQADLFVTLKGQELRLLGDGRCDSPGHSAKYLTYNFVDAETSKVVHSIQVQSPDVKSSSQMEKAGFVKGLDDLRRADLEIAAITTDRHPSIRKHLRGHEPEVEHELDSWHVAKGLQKKLDAASKRKECSSLRGWIRNICNHLNFCVALSEGDVTMRLSIWKIKPDKAHNNVHDGHEGPFHRCLHDELPPHEWLDPGTPAYQKLVSIVLNPLLLKHIEQLSTASQTSCLESFPSLIIQFAPKSTAYTPSVMCARTQLAILHHNENVGREQATDILFHFRQGCVCEARIRVADLGNVSLSLTPSEQPPAPASTAEALVVPPLAGLPSTAEHPTTTSAEPVKNVVTGAVGTGPASSCSAPLARMTPEGIESMNTGGATRTPSLPAPPVVTKKPETTAGTNPRGGCRKDPISVPPELSDEDMDPSTSQPSRHAQNERRSTLTVGKTPSSYHRL